MKKHTFLVIVIVLIFSSCSTEELIPTYTLAVSVTPAEAGKIIISPQSQNYKEGDLVTLTAVPNENWVFENWGVDGSGNSTPLQITMTANKSVVGNFFRNQTIASGDVINPKTGKIWMDRNLGASRVAISSTDEESYGDLYQWGRGADGHQKRNSSTSNALSSLDVPVTGNFIISPSDWRSPQNDNLWKGVDGVNNPCPSGYRIPTEAEWNAERQSWSTNNPAGAFASPLKLPSAGYRLYSNGSLYFVGTRGYYWSSTVSSTTARDLYFDSSNANLTSSQRAFGHSVRCIKD